MDLICEQNMVFDTIENPILRPNSPPPKIRGHASGLHLKRDYVARSKMAWSIFIDHAVLINLVQYLL